MADVLLGAQYCEADESRRDKVRPQGYAYPDAACSLARSYVKRFCDKLSGDKTGVLAKDEVCCWCVFPQSC